MQLAAASFEDLVNRFILAHTNVREQLKSIMSRTPSITSGFNPVDGELAVERAVQEVFLGHIVRIEQLLEPVAASFRQVIESLAAIEKSHKSLAADLGIDWSDLKSAAAATRSLKEGSAWRYLFNSLREGFSDRPALHRQFAEFDGLVDQASIKAQSALTAITNMRDEIAMIRDFALRTDGRPGFDPVGRETASSIEPTVTKLDASIMYMAWERAEAQALQQRRVREFNRKQNSK
ncbi:unnamed protein product [Zymoseptoria tritici ST99CH_3D7]|uniref:Uncharacterized protein n=1 Tax=Zymoseptoria tritici (strain ST99CH_3D7) TaxID=1276538 RepID=A0A1X7RE79_ZYMT9|nr:unnamed protein product [Zymoseptoria tritici ST99CH_3D7]